MLNEDYYDYKSTDTLFQGFLNFFLLPSVCVHFLWVVWVVCGVCVCWGMNFSHISHSSHLGDSHVVSTCDFEQSESLTLSFHDVASITRCTQIHGTRASKLYIFRSCMVDSLFAFLRNGRLQSYGWILASTVICGWLTHRARDQHRSVVSMFSQISE